MRSAYNLESVASYHFRRKRLLEMDLPASSEQHTGYSRYMSRPGELARMKDQVFQLGFREMAPTMFVLFEVPFVIGTLGIIRHT